MGRFFLALGRDVQDEKGKKWVFQAMGCLPLSFGLCTKFSWCPLAAGKINVGGNFTI